MNYEGTLPDLVERYDKGGGVCLGNTFVVHTTTRSLRSFQNVIVADHLRGVNPFPQLAEAAVTVLKTIQVYCHADDLPEGQFISLPRLSADWKPWYLTNAAMSDNHCIVGFNNVIETLLVVLRRPWCILELCCTKLESIEALYHFATLAYGIDCRGYAAAVALFSHELSKKRGIDRCDRAGNGATMQEMQDFCTAIFFASEISFNSFWLRALCVSALKLDVAFSEIACCLIQCDKQLAVPFLQSHPSTSRCRNTTARINAKYTGPMHEFPVISRKSTPLPLQIPTPRGISVEFDCFILHTYAEVLFELMYWKV